MKIIDDFDIYEEISLESKSVKDPHGAYHGNVKNIEKDNTEVMKRSSVAIHNLDGKLSDDAKISYRKYDVHAIYKDAAPLLKVAKLVKEISNNLSTKEASEEKIESSLKDLNKYGSNAKKFEDIVDRIDAKSVDTRTTFKDFKDYVRSAYDVILPLYEAVIAINKAYNAIMGLRSVRNDRTLSSELLSNKGQVKRSLDVIATVSNVYHKFFQKVDAKAAKEPEKLLKKNKKASGSESIIDEKIIEALYEEYGIEGVASIIRNISNK